jgi:hypothetical protein
LCGIHGSLHTLDVEVGDPSNIYKRLMGGTFAPWRSVFRPEIYQQDQFYKLKKYSEITSAEVSKDPNISFKPYIWH